MHFIYSCFIKFIWFFFFSSWNTIDTIPTSKHNLISAHYKSCFRILYHIASTDHAGIIFVVDILLHSQFADFKRSNEIDARFPPLAATCIHILRWYVQKMRSLNVNKHTHTHTSHIRTSDFRVMIQCYFIRLIYRRRGTIMFALRIWCTWWCFKKIETCYMVQRFLNMI